MSNESTISRRRFVKGSAVLPLAASLPAVAQSSAPHQTDKHPCWHRDWKQAMHDFDLAADGPKAGNGSSPEENDAYRRSWDAAEKICNTPADTLEGVEAQLAHFVENFGDYCLDNIGKDLDRMLIQNILDSVRRINRSVTA